MNSTFEIGSLLAQAMGARTTQLVWTLGLAGCVAAALLLSMAWMAAGILRPSR